MTLYLVRHGETEWNVQRRLQGQSDSPLTERGLAQAQAYGELLASVLGSSAVEVWHSPLPRARRTASLLAMRLSVPAERCHASDLLRERHCGAWEGMDFAAFSKEHGAEEGERLYRAWDVRAGGDGETLAEVHARAQAWLAQPRTAAATVVVTHGILSRTFRGAYLALTPDAIIALPSHKQDVIYRLEDGRMSELELPEPPPS